MAKTIRDFQIAPVEHYDAERAVLSNLILFPQLYDKITHLFHYELFYNETNRIIAKAIISLHKNSEEIDIITVAQKCVTIDKDITYHEVVSGTSIDHTVSSAAFEGHIKILTEHHIRREILKTGQWLQVASGEYTEDIDLTLSKLLEKAGNLQSMTIFNRGYNSKEASLDTVRDICDRAEKDKPYRSLGFPMLDQYVYFDSRDIVAVAASQGQGKSKFVMKVAENLIKANDDIAILYYSFEDGHKSIMRNWISSEVMLTPNEMLSLKEKLGEKDLMKISKAFDPFIYKDFEINETRQYIRDIKSSFLRFCKERPDKFNILIVDNLMLLRDYQDSNKKNETAIDDYIAAMFADIKNETVEYNAAIIFVHHINKDAINRKNINTAFRPESTDMRGSTRLADVATNIILINKVNHSKALVSSYPGYEELMENLSIIEVTKNRTGRMGFVRMFADLGYNIYKELSYENV